jgi:hypothetical protein
VNWLSPQKPVSSNHAKKNKKQEEYNPGQNTRTSFLFIYDLFVYDKIPGYNHAS